MFLSGIIKMSVPLKLIYEFSYLPINKQKILWERCIIFEIEWL